MDACPNFRISLFLACCFWLLASVSVQAQLRFPPDTPEPPLANGENPIQLASAQGTTTSRANPNADFGIPSVRVDVIASSVAPANKDLSFRLHVENVSRVPASNVRVLSPLKGARFVKADPAPIAPDAQELEWAFGPLQAGQSKDIEVTVSPAPNSMEFEATGKVRFEHGRKMKVALTKPDLSLKLVMQKDVQQYDIVPVRLQINNPTGVELKDVQVSVVLPAGVAHQDLPADAKGDPQTRTWTLARIGPYETQTKEFQIVANDGTNAMVQATVAGEASASTKFEMNIQAPRLEVSATGPSTARVNQSINYTVTVRNSGSFIMRNVTVSDRLPPTCDFVSASDNGQAFEKEIQWIIPMLHPGETRNLTVTVRSPRNGRIAQQVEAVYRSKRQQTEVSTSFEGESAGN